MAEAAKLKKIQPKGEAIRWSAGALTRTLPIRLRPRAPHAESLTQLTLPCVRTEIDAAVAKAD